jgi:Uma2 family endonuclease
MTSQIKHPPGGIVADELPEPERGWRYVRETLADGREVSRMIPLTSADFLNPREGDVMPQQPFHEKATRDLADILETYFKQKEPTITVFRDLIMKWGVPGLSDPSPDISVVPNVRHPETIEGEFYVAEQGTRPILVIEIVSPHYRQEDRRDKVKIYAQAGVQEYVIIDRFKRRGQMVNEVLGYELEEGVYWPKAPDEDGFIFCQTVGLRFGLDEDQVVVIDDGTGERLLTYPEVVAKAQAAEAKARVAEAKAQAEVEARMAAEKRLAELEAELHRLRGESA